MVKSAQLQIFRLRNNFVGSGLLSVFDVGLLENLISLHPLTDLCVPFWCGGMYTGTELTATFTDVKAPRRRYRFES